MSRRERWLHEEMLALGEAEEAYQLAVTRRAKLVAYWRCCQYRRSVNRICRRIELDERHPVAL